MFKTASRAVCALQHGPLFIDLVMKRDGNKTENLFEERSLNKQLVLGIVSVIRLGWAQSALLSVILATLYALYKASCDKALNISQETTSHRISLQYEAKVAKRQKVYHYP